MMQYNKEGEAERAERSLRAYLAASAVAASGAATVTPAPAITGSTTAASGEVDGDKGDHAGPDDAPATSSARWPLWQIALAIGAALQPLVLTLSSGRPAGASFSLLMAVGVVCAAYGARRAGRELGWNGLMLLGWTAVAALPGIGTFACALLLYWTLTADSD